MQYSTNYNMNKPELNEQYRLSHWNDNTDIIDTELKRNADDISSEATRATNAETALQNITNETFKTALLNFCYPIGSIYWSGVATNPHDLFGGTWEQIKDKFVWAKGDNDTLDATGGEKTHTLTVTEIPSHNHSFTPSGSISITTNPTFSGSEHSHTYTPAGTISITTNPTFTGSAVTSGGSGEHTHVFATTVASPSSGTSSNNLNFSFTNSIGTQNSVANSGFAKGSSYKLPKGNVTNFLGCCIGGTIDKRQTDFYTDGVVVTLSGYHTHSVTASGTISGGAYKFTGTQATLKATAGGSISGGAYKFTGSAGTTGNKGDGGAHNNMPPYIVKYCWQRTA